MTAADENNARAVVWSGKKSVVDLRVHRREFLPPHFVPQKFETAPSIPRNASGKIERK